MNLRGLKAFKDVINKLNNNSLCKRDSEGNDIVVNFKMNEPTTHGNILELEEKLQFNLPYSYKQFLLNHNGGRIYDYDNLDGFILFGTDNILKINNEVSDSYNGDWINGIFIFAELIGEGNYLGLDTRNNEYTVLDCFHEELPESWSVISEDFDKWLESLVLNEGLKFWLYKDKSSI